MDADNNAKLLDLKLLISTKKSDRTLESKYEEVAQDILAHKLTIVHLIECLGGLLMNAAHSERTLGVLVITSVIEKLPLDFLSSEQLTVLSNYLCEKLKDHHEVAAGALKGVLTITRCKNITDDAIILLVSSIFHNITCQQQQQPHRYIVYEIFEVILHKHFSAVNSMGMDFVYGVISAIDGERDPKNLLYLFSWIGLFVKNVKLGHLTEEMFNVLSCYFPVDFKSSAKEVSIGITRQTLADALCPCLTAIPDFAEYCIELALEKLDSSLKIAKIDSLALLKEGCKTFTTSSYIQHSSEIWSYIQKEVFSCSDEEVTHHCLETLSVVIRNLSEGNEASFKATVNDIADTLKGNLIPELKLFHPSSLMLVATAAACKKSSIIITKKIVPLLENTFSIVDDKRGKAEILKLLIELLKTCIVYHEGINIFEMDEFQGVPMLCFKASIHSDYCLKSAGLFGCAEIAEFIPHEVKLSLVTNLHYMITQKRDESLKSAVLECLRKIAIFYPEDVKKEIFFDNMLTHPVLLDFYLEALCSIISVNKFTEIVTNVLLSYSFCQDLMLSEVAQKNIRILLENCTDAIIFETFVKNGTIEKIFNYAVQHKNELGELKDWLKETICVLKKLVGSLDSVTQTGLIEKQLAIVQDISNNDCIYVTLLNGLLTNLHCGIEVNDQIIDELFKICLNTCDHFTRDRAVQLLANIINKMDDGEILKCKLAHIQQCTKSRNCKSFNELTVIVWITKALVMRNHSESHVWMDLLFEMLDKWEDTAKEFGVILDENCDTLGLENHCKQTLLYRQKFFIICTNKLAQGFTIEKTSYLNAIGYLIKYAPKQAVLMQFGKISNLVLMCLEKSEDIDVLQVVLNLLGTFINKKESIVEDHLEDFISRILALTSFEKSMRVRIAALNCLQQITVAFPIYKLLPLQRQVIQHLGSCIDDKKRLVRKEAIEARCLWYLLDAPI